MLKRVTNKNLNDRQKSELKKRELKFARPLKNHKKTLKFFSLNH